MKLNLALLTGLMFTITNAADGPGDWDDCSDGSGAKSSATSTRTGQVAYQMAIKNAGCVLANDKATQTEVVGQITLLSRLLQATTLPDQNEQLQGVLVRLNEKLNALKLSDANQSSKEGFFVIK
jgi:hypothetical protein